MICRSVAAQYGVRTRVVGELDLLPDDLQDAMRVAVEATAHHTTSRLNICFAYGSVEEMARASVLAFGQQGGAMDVSVKKTDQDVDFDLCNDNSPPALSDVTASSGACSSELSSESDNGALSDSVETPLHDTCHHYPDCFDRSDGRMNDIGAEKRVDEDAAADAKALAGDMRREGASSANDGNNDVALAAAWRKQIDEMLHTRDCPPVDMLIRTSGETRLSNFLLWQVFECPVFFCGALWPDFSLRDLVIMIIMYQAVRRSQAQRKRE